MPLLSYNSALPCCCCRCRCLLVLVVGWSVRRFPRSALSLVVGRRRINRRGAALSQRRPCPPRPASSAHTKITQVVRPFVSLSISWAASWRLAYGQSSDSRNLSRLSSLLPPARPPPPPPPPPPRAPPPPPVVFVVVMNGRMDEWMDEPGANIHTHRENAKSLPPHYKNSRDDE